MGGLTEWAAGKPRAHQQIVYIIKTINNFYIPNDVQKFIQKLISSLKQCWKLSTDIDRVLQSYFDYINSTHT